MGECCGLKWKDVVFSEKSIHICRNLVKVTGEEIIGKEPKTASRDQKVYFSLVLNVHGLWHTAASLMISGGADSVATVSGLLGYSQVFTTLAINTHVFDEMKRKVSAEIQGGWECRVPLYLLYGLLSRRPLTLLTRNY